VNCSFGLPPTSFDPLHPEFRRAITELTRTGGRRGKGLVMVFSAANDDAPTFLPGSQNTQGVKFVRFTAFGTAEIAEIPAGQDVFSGYPMTPGVVVVGAMTSLKRKAGYACWGPHVTVVAPSNNMHYITSFVAAGADSRRAQFVTNYRGLGQVAAVNRPGHGQPFDPLLDDLATPEFHENFYTRNFGGTSGAAPIVTGVAALILSANPGLTADQIRQILMATADQDLASTLDLASDPNLQGLSGAFANGRSLFFGSGKVNALKAVQQARALAGSAFRTPSIPPIGAVGVQAPSAVMTPGLIGAPSASFPPGHLRDGDLVFTRTRDPSAVQATQGGPSRVSIVAAPAPAAKMFGAGGLDMLSLRSAAAPVLGPMPAPAAALGEHIQGVIHYRGATAWVLEALRGWSLLFIYVSDPGPVGQEDFAAAAQHCVDLGISDGQGFGFFGMRGVLSGQAVIRWLSP
jgi:hypothetical protein